MKTKSKRFVYLVVQWDKSYDTFWTIDSNIYTDKERAKKAFDIFAGCEYPRISVEAFSPERCIFHKD